MNLAITGKNRRNVDVEDAHLINAVNNALERVGDNTRWRRAIEKAATWLMAQETIVFDGDHQELIGVGSATGDRVYSPSPLSCQCEAFAKNAPCWHRAAALLVKRAAGLKAKAQIEDVAIRLATWQLRGWVPQSMDITELKNGERFAEWRDTQGRRWTADLAPNENYVILPLHCREVCMNEERVVLTPQRLERARQWIADMLQFV